MKKLFLLAVVILSASVIANAQFGYGIKAGMNLAALNGGEVDKMKAGFQAGVFGQLKIANFAIQPEVLFSMQGGAAGSASLNMNYINIPVMLQYYLIPGLALEAGPQFGLLLSAKAEGEDIKDAFKTTDFGINFGASYKLPLLPLGVFARYSLGLTNLDKIADDGKNGVIQVGAFLKF